MSFKDEVDAVRSAKSLEETRQQIFEEPARIQFETETRELWAAAKAYWRSNAQPVDTANTHYVETGRWNGPRMVDAPFPILQVYTRSRTRTEWKYGSHVPHVAVDGVSVGGWFALSAPGDVRELQISPALDLGHKLLVTDPDKAEMRDTLRRANKQGYLQVPWSTVRSAMMGGEDGASFGMAFVGRKGDPDIALRCTPLGPIEVFSASSDGWHRIGTLREFLVSAVAGLPYSP